MPCRGSRWCPPRRTVSRCLLATLHTHLRWSVPNKRLSRGSASATSKGPRPRTESPLRSPSARLHATRRTQNPNALYPFRHAYSRVSTKSPRYVGGGSDHAGRAWIVRAAERGHTASGSAAGGSLVQQDRAQSAVYDGSCTASAILPRTYILYTF